MAGMILLFGQFLIQPGLAAGGMYLMGMPNMQILAASAASAVLPAMVKGPGMVLVSEAKDQTMNHALMGALGAGAAIFFMGGDTNSILMSAALGGASHYARRMFPYYAAN